MNLSLAELMQPVVGAAPLTTNGALTGCDWVSVKNCSGKMAIVAILKQAVAHTTLLTPKMATAAAGTNAAVLAENCQIWKNVDASLGTALTRIADAKNFTLPSAAKSMIVVFEIDPATLGNYSDGTPFTFLTLVTDDSSQATNFAAILFVNLNPTFGGDSAPSIIE